METLRQQIDDIDEKIIYKTTEIESPQRFNLREASSKIAEPVSFAINRSWNRNRGKLNSSASYDSIDFVYTDNICSENNLVFPSPSCEYYDYLPDIDFDITVISHEDSDVDASYLHSNDFDDEGLIEVTIKVSTDPKKAKAFLSTLFLELRAAITHEMQHSVQRVINGSCLGSSSFLDLESHINNSLEIDARVEENIAYLEDHIDEDDLDEFVARLSSYVTSYLSRNAPEAPPEQIETYYRTMMDSHVEWYLNKMGLVKLT